MFQVEAIGFWDGEPEVVTATIDITTLAKVVKKLGVLQSVASDDDLSSFYHDVNSEIFNRFYEDGVNDVG